MNRMQSVRAVPGPQRRRKRAWFLILIFLILVYFFAPLRTNFLLLGADDSPSRGSVGRTDTIMLVSVVPLKPYIGVLSIPRDLIGFRIGDILKEHFTFCIHSDAFRKSIIFTYQLPAIVFC